MHCRYTIGQTW